MSRETIEHLNTQTLIGFTDKRGNAWHYRASAQGDEPNHYAGAIPVEDVRRRLFDWHGVEGQITATALTSEGVITTTDPERKAIMRSDTGAILGVFKSGYQVHQYDRWLIENVETLLDADLHVGSAGLLRGGAVAWVQIEVEDTITTPEGVEFRPFLTAATSMDGSLSSTYQAGSQVVVCDNTLSAALGERDSSRVKIKHSRNSMGRIGDVRDALGIVHGIADDFAAQVKALCETTVTDAQWAAFVAKLTETKSESKRAQTLAQTKASALTRMYRHDERAAQWQGTAYGVLAAVNTYVHHEQTVRGATRAERNAERVVMGDVDKLDRTTLDTLQLVLS